MGKKRTVKEILEMLYGVKLEDPTPEKLERTRKGLEEYQRGLKERKSSQKKEAPENEP